MALWPPHRLVTCKMAQAWISPRPTNPTPLSPVNCWGSNNLTYSTNDSLWVKCLAITTAHRLKKKRNERKSKKGNVEITIERVPNEKDYIVRVNGQFTITTTWAEDEADVKAWVQLIRKIYRGKRRRRVVSIAGDRSINYANGRSFHLNFKGNHKDEPYELLQICIEYHCLLCKLNTDSWLEWELSARMEKDHGWVLPKLVELRDLAAAQARKARTTTTTTMGDDDDKKKDQTTIIDFSRFGIAKLAREVFGEEMEMVKPTKVTWWAQPSWPIPRFLTDDMVKYATVEAFLASQVGIKLILETETAATTQY
ncbi:Ribonuclease H-like domain containing protein [Trema orientale]|uniref:Ribonuclease H-like domain containing protein n=1 Tax=Trema orientale TaxID=63057 RepID=A0A2P5F167_TREOI|nr:Ribonuclease H-like domain containing protein [Trema orientale]